MSVTKWIIKPFRVIQFLGFYVVTLWRANIRVALDILTPGFRMQPGFIAIDLQTRNDFEILVLSNLVSMTPGTLTVDVSEDGKRLFIHATYLADAELVRRQIGTDLQGKILEVLR